MKRLLAVMLGPLLLFACSDAKQVMRNASQYMQDDCTTKQTFDEVLVCTQNRLYNDPVTSFSPNPAENAEITAYGEQISSQLRQHYITDAQARQIFAQKLTEVRGRHIPTPAQ